MQYVLQDPLNRLHWNTLKSIFATLSLLPMVYLFQHLWNFSDQSELIIIRFFALNILGAWLLVCFYWALTIHHNKDLRSKFKTSNNPLNIWLIKIYSQLPILFFTSLVGFISVLW